MSAKFLYFLPRTMLERLTVTIQVSGVPRPVFPKTNFWLHAPIYSRALSSTNISCTVAVKKFSTDHHVKGVYDTVIKLHRRFDCSV